MSEPSRNTRRTFIKHVAAGSVGAAFAHSLPASSYARALTGASPNETVAVGVIGTGGRGSSLARSFAKLPGATVAYVCDVDERRVAETRTNVQELQETAPQAVSDFRRILDDPAVDAMVIAMPEHWHTPAALLAMQAGKHVYVEKPGSHNPREGEMIVAASRQHGRVVQMGNQRRSWPGVIEAMERIRDGVVGPVHYARGWYANARTSIGRGQAVEVPAWLDYELWQGPAPRQPYRDNILHYNWHWFWNWGTGEAGNNGVHSLDLCRWGLDVELPVRVTSSGGRYFFQDDQETPDTQIITFEFEDGKTVMWEGLSCSRRGIDGESFGASIHGENGTVVIEGQGYSIYDQKGERIEEVSTGGAQPIDVTGPSADLDAGHLANFLEGIRSGAQLYAPISDGQKSTLLSHLGNIALRTGHALRCNPENGHIENDAEAMALWGREYAPGWEPEV